MNLVTSVPTPEPGTHVPTEIPQPTLPPLPEAPPEIVELPPSEPTLPVREPGTVVPAQASF